jgi:Helix-turn-helix domain
MNRETFGNYLKTARASRSLPLAEVARITKIPERSLELMERGASDGLPADVYVKGFVSSYARVVGLDVAEAVARYSEAMRAEIIPPRPTGLAALLAPGLSADAEATARDRQRERDEAARLAANRAAVAKVERQTPSANAKSAPRATTNPVPGAPGPQAQSQGYDEEEGGPGRYRVGLTFAVIVLVIIATLTLSFLLRRPSQDGDSASPVSQLDRAR